MQPKPPTIKGPTEWFTGDVWIDPIVQTDRESTLNIGPSTSPLTPAPPGAPHDGGQSLEVTEGRGLVQSRGDDGRPTRADR